jgi:hypothetical protein
MTLKEKFKKQLDTATPTLNRPFYQAEKCEQIAEDFAIGFTKWCASDEAQSLIKDLMLVGEINKVLELKDLMKIYKKEKSL